LNSFLAGENGFIFSRYISFLFKFLLWVEGLGFFLVLAVAGASFSWVDREKEKEVPREREKLKVFLWLASAWQNSRHLAAKPVLVTSAVDILVVILNQKNVSQKRYSQSWCQSEQICCTVPHYTALYCTVLY
jgi:hypothetical protein